MPKKSPNKPFQAMALSTTVVSYLVGPLLIGLFGGRWLDRYFSTSPLFLIIGMLLGLATGIFGLLRVLKTFLGDDNHE